MYKNAASPATHNASIRFCVIGLALSLLAAAAHADLSVSSISPLKGVVGIDLTLTIEGSGFDENTRVSISGESALPDVLTSGKPDASVLVGDRLYLLLDSYLKIYDIHSPGESTLLGSLAVVGNRLAVANDKAYLAGFEGLLIVDVSTPSSPQVLNTQTIPVPRANDVVVQDDTTQTVPAPHPSDVVVREDIAYVVYTSFGNGYGALQVIDVSISENPVLLANLDIPGFVEKLMIVGDTAYIVGFNSGLHVVDISTPSVPRLLGSVYTELSVDVFATDELAYIADGVGGFAVVDVSDKSSPVVISSVEMPGNESIHRISVIGDRAVVSGGDRAWIVDVSDPYSPVIAGRADYFAPEGVLDYLVAAGPQSIGISNLQVSLVSDSEIQVELKSPGEAGSYTYEVSVASAVGFETVTVTVDFVINEPPMIQLIGSSRATVQVADSYVDEGVIALDPEDGVLTDYSIDDQVDSTMPGIYSFSYTVTDSAGAESSVSRIVTVTNEAVFVDSDNDGVIDSSDVFPEDASESLDTDNDGIGNNADRDDDNDGVVDALDAFPLDLTETRDSDWDGMGDIADQDDDGDGILDVDDLYPLDPTNRVELTVTSDTPLMGIAGRDLQLSIAGSGFDADTRVSLISDWVLPEALETGYSQTTLVVVDDIVYLRGRWDFQIFDISSPPNWTLLGSLDLDAGGWGQALPIMVVEGDKAYVSLGGGLGIIDVSTPSSPQFIGSHATPTLNMVDVAIKDSIAYVSYRGSVNWGEGGLQVIDVSIPESPVVIARLELSKDPGPISLVDDFLYLDELIVDISVPSLPTVVGTIPGPRRAFRVLGDLAFSAQEGDQGLYVLDISDKTAPNFVAYLPSPEYGSIDSLTAIGDRLFVQIFSRNPSTPWIVDIVDISDPFRPVIETQAEVQLSRHALDYLATLGPESLPIKSLDTTVLSDTEIRVLLQSPKEPGTYELAVYGASGFKQLQLVVHEPPAIQLIGSSRVTVRVGDTYVDAGAMARDPEDGVLANFVIDDQVDTSAPGVYSFSYTVADLDGAESSISRIVTVTDDSVSVDTDGDGVIDSSDVFPADASEFLDTDNDGIGNNADTDDDNDGVPDDLDALPLDLTETEDFDADGIGNNADTDDDNDGIPDEADIFPFNPSNLAPGRLRNLSSRGYVGEGDNVLIGGLIITGTEPKTVVIRARGPSLADAGVSGALLDPEMVLFSGASPFDGNEHWESHAGVSLIPEDLKPTAYPNEAVIATTLAPGAYTAIVGGKNGTTGIGLVEIFEVDDTGVTRLQNIATRGFVGTGDKVLIGGLVVAGDKPKQVVIRAKGPSLAELGVKGALADPLLSIFSGTELILQNDDWGTVPIREDACLPLDLRPNNSADAAVVLSLPPGSYTAIVEGADGGSGIAIVEVFEVLETGTPAPVDCYEDTDGDSVFDAADAFPENSMESVDSDSDGVGNNTDTDDDNDGVPDTDDDFPLDAAESVDTDGDGLGNNADTDDDSDGVPDTDDDFPLDAAESVDTDGDGLGNNADTDDDNDGVLDVDDDIPLDAAESVDTDGDGIGNNEDTDDDNDGTPDDDDIAPLDSDLPVITTRFFYMATRGYVGSGDNVMIGRFTIGGSEPKTVILRTRGPALVEWGLSGTLADPEIALFSGATVIDSNDNWETHPGVDLIPQDLKPTAYPLEAVIATTLEPGTYTAIIGGKDGAEGLAYLEMYGIETDGESRFVELATRGLVGTGENVLVGGFVIRGPEGTSRKVVIRGLGPSLAEQGVPGTLANPEIAIFSGATVIKTNNDWDSSDNIDKEKIPAGLRPTNSLESAVYMELAPGPYTAIVDGADGGTGVGIVEVFEVLD
ncbi:MAG: immunoglobulin-like domain-containing protein [Pseudomonadota bacterium]